MFDQYYRIGKAVGIHVQLSSEEGWKIAACSVKVERKKLDIEKRLTNISHLDDLTKKIPASIPVALNLSGKGVLIKKVEKQAGTDENLIAKALPNAKAEDFYIQNFEAGDSVFVALIRRTDADKWISRLEKLGYQVILFSLGPFVIRQILPQLNVYEKRLVADGHQVEYDEKGNWTSYSYNAENKSPFALKIGDEKIEESLVIPYACALQLALSPDLSPVSADVPTIDKNLEQKLADKRFMVTGPMVLCVFFILLLINFALFSYLHEQNQRLSEEVSRSSHDISDSRKLDQQITDQEAMVKQMGWEGATSKSQLIDQVAQLLPAEIKWEKVSVDPPLPAAPGMAKVPQFAEKLIVISGYSDRIIPVNEWIARIKTRSWVKDVQLENYVFNNELNTGQFNIQIKY